MKRYYQKPIITVTDIEIECALASGSARVLATDDDFNLYEEWVEEEERRTIDW